MAKKLKFKSIEASVKKKLFKEKKVEARKILTERLREIEECRRTYKMLKAQYKKLLREDI